MIAKGNLHGDGGGLARYLMTGEKGEIARLVETRGLENFGDDPVQAFAMLQKVAEANTKSPLPFFHTQTRNAPGEHLTDAQWLQVADREEKRLGLTGQPRIVSFHIDPEHGEKHLHVGWFRIDLETMRAIDSGMYKNHLKQLSRSLEKEFCLREVSNFRKPDDPARAADRKEVEESRRLGTDNRAIRAAILDCLEHADGGKAFRAALDERGLMLANGDKRDCFVVVDQAGGHHALNKKLTGHTLAETREQLADLDRAQLPSVEQAQEMQRTRTAERDRAGEIDRAAQAGARGKYDSLQEAERQVARDQFPGRYDELRAAEPPPEVVREFKTNANRTAEPAAPIYDRDQDNAAWEAKLADAAINAEARKAHHQPGVTAERETRSAGPQPSGGPERRPEAEDMRPLGKTAGDIRSAWRLSRTAGELEEALAAKGITLAAVSREEAEQSHRTAAFAKEVGNYARLLRAGEIVAIDQYGKVHRLDQRTTGDLRPEIEARLDGFGGIDRATLLNVTDARAAMQEASRAAWIEQRRAEQEKARPPSAMEGRIIECAEQARINGALIERDAEGRRIFGAEALSARLDPTGERVSESVTVFGPEAFAARLQQAGIAVVRVTVADVLALDALRRDEDLARLAAETNREARRSYQFAEVLPGDLAAVTPGGDVHRLNPDKLGGAAKQLAADLPSVVEARAAFEIDREATADLWAGLRAENARADALWSENRDAEQAIRSTDAQVSGAVYDAADAVEAGLDAASSIGSRLAKAVETMLGRLSDFLFGAEPKLTPDQAERRAASAHEQAEVNAQAAAAQEKAADQDERIFNQDRQQQQEDFAARYGVPGGSSGRSRERDEDYDRGRERER